MEAKRAKSPQRDDEFWKSLEKMAGQVDSWPQWIKGGEGRKSEAVSGVPQSPGRWPETRKDSTNSSCLLSCLLWNFRHNGLAHHEQMPWHFGSPVSRCSCWSPKPTFHPRSQS